MFEQLTRIYDSALANIGVVKPILGLITAGGVVSIIFFLWRLSTGHLITNIALSLRTKRLHRNATNDDDLVIIIELNKGTRNAAKLRSLSLQIFQLERNIFRAKDIGIRPRRRAWRRWWVPIPKNRSTNAAGRLTHERDILAIWTTEERRSLNLAPSEKTEYASYAVVEADGVYEIVVTLAAERYLTRAIHIAFWIGYFIFWCLYLRTYIAGPTVYYTASTISLPRPDRVDFN